MGMFSSLCISVLFLFHWDELWLLSPWLWLFILLLLLSPSVPQQLCPPSSTEACLQLCHPAHPLQLSARVPRALVWLSLALSSCLALPCGTGAPSLPRMLPPPWL